MLKMVKLYRLKKKRVQFVAKDVLRTLERLQTELFDVTARKDWSNCAAFADIVVDGIVIIPQAPVSFLLFLEKQMNDIHTFIEKLPTLDEGEDWIFDEALGLYKTETTKTHRTKKISRPIVLFPATPEHPAQTQLIQEDVIDGFWNLVKQSGAIPKPEKQSLLAKSEKLIRAIKEAREAANGTDEAANVPSIGAAVFGYILGD